MRMLTRIIWLCMLATNGYCQQTTQHGTKQICRQAHLSYLLYLPQTYSTATEPFPLLLYLHGGSLRGDSLSTLRKMGLPQRLEQDTHFPFVVVSPQCPKGEIWTDSDPLITLLDQVIKTYRIDPRRVYLTGHSMGGRGTWYLAYKHPERFAAIAPMSAFFTIDEWAGRLKDVPVWVFHGARDELAPVGESRHMVELLKKAGGTVKYTELPDRDHFGACLKMLKYPINVG